MLKICTEYLPTVGKVRDHLMAHRDDLRNCVVGFSGGKDSVLLARLVRELDSRIPLVYASCPGCEWPQHLGFVASFGAVVLNSGHGAGWFEANPWAFLPADSRGEERWAIAHHRGLLRRYAAACGKVLLWGNRTHDGNTVPAVRYKPKGGCELWMPLRDVRDADLTAELRPGDYSPAYRIPGSSGTDWVFRRKVYRGCTPETARDEASKAIGGTPEFEAFDRLFRARYPC